MVMMPISTYKPPTFGLVEDYFNDAHFGLLRRWAALVKLASLADPDTFDPVTAKNGRFVPVSDRQVDHFGDHWMGAKGLGAYWPGFPGLEDRIRRRLVQGFVNGLVYSVIPSGPDLSVLSHPGVLFSERSYPRLDLTWVCSNPDSNAKEFLVRPLVYECDIKMIFLTPWPKGITPTPGSDPDLESGGGGAEPRLGDEPVDPQNFPSEELLTAAQDEVADAIATDTGDPTCCPRWSLKGVTGAAAFGARAALDSARQADPAAVEEFIAEAVVPAISDVEAAFPGELDPGDVDAARTVQCMVDAAQDRIRFVAADRAAALAAGRLAPDPLSLVEPEALN